MSLTSTISLSFLVRAKIFKSVLLFFVEMLRDKQFWAEIFNEGKRLGVGATIGSFITSDVEIVLVEC
jgi:hypothetical protein